MSKMAPILAHFFTFVTGLMVSTAVLGSDSNIDVVDDVDGVELLGRGIRLYSDGGAVVDSRKSASASSMSG